MGMEWEYYGLKVSVGGNWDDELGYRSEKWLGGNLSCVLRREKDKLRRSTV